MSKHSGNAVWCWNTRQSKWNIRGLLVWSLEFGTILFSGSDREPEDLPRLRPVNQKDNHTRKHSLLYRLFHSKRDHHLQNEHHSVLKNTWNKQVSKKKKLQVRSRVVFLTSLHTCYPPHTHTLTIREDAGLRRFLISFPFQSQQLRLCLTVTVSHTSKGFTWVLYIRIIGLHTTPCYTIDCNVWLLTAYSVSPLHRLHYISYHIISRISHVEYYAYHIQYRATSTSQHRGKCSPRRKQYTALIKCYSTAYIYRSRIIILSVHTHPELVTHAYP